MKLALASISTPDLTPEQAVQLAVKAGYEGIEWRMSNDSFDPNAAHHFRHNNKCSLSASLKGAKRGWQLCADSGLDFVGLSCYITPGDLREAERICLLAAAVQAPYVRVWSPPPEAGHYRELLAQTLEYFEALNHLAGRYGTRFVVETHQKTITPSASLAWNLVHEFDPSRIGVLYDAGNLVVEGFEDPRIGLELLGPHLAAVQVKNAGWESDQAGTWKWAWRPLHDGILDIPRLVQQLQTVGYDGHLIVEDLSFHTRTPEAVHANASYLRSLIDTDFTPRLISERLSTPAAS